MEHSQENIVKHFVKELNSPTNNSGYGVIVGQYFITVGHLFDECDSYSFVHEKKTYTLRKEEAKLCEDTGLQNNGHDIAIFKLKNIESPLELAHSVPYIGQELRHVRTRLISEQCIVGFSSPITKCISGRGIVDEVARNCFVCKMDVKLFKGSSGSPIMLDNTIYGIVVGGEEERIIYQSLHLFQDYIQNI